VDEELFSDPLIQAVCALEVRYDFGNSFFAHPSVRGNQQIKDAVMDALTNGSHADRFIDKKMEQYADFREELLNSLCKKVEEMIVEGIINLGCMLGEQINDFAVELLNSCCEEVYATLNEDGSIDKMLVAVDEIHDMVNVAKNKIDSYQICH
jgi:hypothetical protein